MMTDNPGMVDIEVTVNGTVHNRKVATDSRLVDLLRNDLRLTGTKEVCGEGECGACTVLMDDIPVNSCLIFAVEAHGSVITTIEGISREDELNSLQQSFVDAHAIQCGYCIPGMVLVGEYVLRERPNPSREEIRRELAGNICRCTGYKKILDAVESAARGQH